VSAAGAQDGGRPAEAHHLTREIANSTFIWTRLSRRSARTHDARTLYAVDAKGGGRSPAIIRKMSANRSHGMATSAKWKTARRAWLTISGIWNSRDNRTFRLHLRFVGNRFRMREGTPA
jgi:hypothetical protein